MTPQDAAKVAAIPELLGFLPYLEAMVREEQAATVRRVRTAITKGDLTPEAALAFWLEYEAAEALLMRFKGRIAGSRSISAANASAMI